MVKRVLFCFEARPLNYNHGVALLSRICKDAGIHVDVLVISELPKFKEYLVGKHYDHIGFSCVALKDYTDSIPFIEYAVEQGFTVSLGGTYFRRDVPTKFDDLCLICRGEGELLPQFILHGDRTIFDTQYVALDLDALPLPDYDLPEMVYDGDIPKLDPGKMIPYYSSRGCIGKCSFCEVQHQTGKVRIRRKVKEDLSALADKYCPDMFFMGDELLPYYDDEWCKSWGDFRHPFYCYIRADITEERLLWLIDRGMVGCAFGVESGDETYRNEVLGKGLLDSEIFRTAKILREYGKHFVHFYMLGTEKETFAIKAKTNRFKESLGGVPIVFGFTKISYGTR